MLALLAFGFKLYSKGHVVSRSVSRVHSTDKNSAGFIALINSAGFITPINSAIFTVLMSSARFKELKYIAYYTVPDSLY